MALSENEKLTIAKILRTNYVVVNDQITNLGATYITATVETAIRDELTRWETAGVDFVDVDPNERNFGARIRADRAKNDIRSNLANLLYLDKLANTSGRLQRS